MRHHLALFVIVALLLYIVPAEAVETAANEWDATALYENGFAQGVMRSQKGTGIQLNDMTLLENDGPGAGYSEKGPFLEPLHTGVLARKTFTLDDARAMEAHVVLYLEYKGTGEAPPYYLVVNGNRVEGIRKPWHDGLWHWVPIPVDILRKGENTIIIGCDAPTGHGYNLLFARDDEYDRGGGRVTLKGNTAMIASGFVTPPRHPDGAAFARIQVGSTSAKSMDGGATWIEGSLGPESNVPGEYTIRLNLTRYGDEGSCTTLPMDLWSEIEGFGPLSPTAEVKSLRLTGEGATPPGTAIEWQVRFAGSPDPASPEWGSFTALQSGAQCDVNLVNVPQRFMQARVVLRSSDPLSTPVAKRLRVERVMESKPLQDYRVYPRDAVQPQPVFSSYSVAYENYDRGELTALWERLDLGRVTGATCGDFERVNLVRHHVSQQWYHELPLPDYPEWDALAILDRRDAKGAGGMCIQFAITFMHALQACGYQARHVNVFNHETIEVYVDELEKWVVVDPESLFDSYEYRTDTGEPVNVLEQHYAFLARYGFDRDRQIPWMAAEPWCNWLAEGVKESPQPLEISTFTGWINDPDSAKRPPQHNLAGFFRITPRNDFYSRPIPRPLSQGSTYWPWNGYLCWYDEATPRHMQYSLHSDRPADFYPTLNRVHYTATLEDNPGVVQLAFFTQTPNFAGYEVNVDETGWREAGSDFRWELKRSALNRIQMRVRNKAGVIGKPSTLSLLYHYAEPYTPKVAAQE
ncbi:MAG: hypothetical protein AMXMBFR84_17640 [Candidatus Hydrogenedentota bacterium]